jgi:flagellar basal-body rod modification protein FlgD
MPIEPTSVTGYTTSASAAKSKEGNLGKDDFLKLLVAQLKNQDPSNAQDMSAMTEQMTQFSILEQLTNLSKTSDEQNISAAREHAVGLLGKTVSFKGADGGVQTGTVEHVDVTAMAPRLTIGGTGGVFLGDITSVR